MTPTTDFGTRLAETRMNQRGAITWYKFEVFHNGLREIRTVGDADYDVAERKAHALLAKLKDKWAQLQAQEDVRQQKRDGKVYAESQTAKAVANVKALKTILGAGVARPAEVDWKQLEDAASFAFSEVAQFPLVEFEEGGEPIAAKHFSVPGSPDSTAPKYRPALNLFDRLWTPSRRKKEGEAQRLFDGDVTQWKAVAAAIKEKHDSAARMLVDAKAAFLKEKSAFTAKQTERNAKLAAFETAYVAGDRNAVARYCETLLGMSKYPEFLDIEFTAGFNPDNGMAVIECELPDKGALPTLQKVTFTASSNETKEKHMPEAERDRLYDSLLYQVALRTVFEIFHGDTHGFIKLAVFNGWVDALNPATGQRNHGCILSLQASKEEFSAIDLEKVDPRACFRQLKGVSAARLSGMTPVRPILQLQTDDPRFVAAHAVADQLQSGYNLATMDWEEFEHLVRELFESEFGANGAEVHVTRASSDGGVDAVVLDPDPIRGGKIVIQAKRYTNTVGLSAVRDLYGTVINEGANRGILVSTADYGADAYDFVKGKPITLLNGSNLLSLLEKHGHKARIDLHEAKIINAQNAVSRGTPSVD
jgi:restriction system protein